MRGYGHLTKALALSQLRDPIGFFFLLVFSPVVLVILGLIFGNEPTPQFGMRGPVDNMLPGLTVISILIIGVLSVPQNQLVLRSTGALTRLRVTPLRPRVYVAADLTVNSALGLAGALLTVGVGVVVFGVEPPRHVAAMVAALVLGLVAMLAIGYTLAAVYPSVGAATGVGNVLMIVFMLTSGAFVPLDAVSGGVRTAMSVSPAYHLAQLVGASWRGQAWNGVSLVALVGVAAVFGALGTVLFRWDRAD